MTAGLEAVNSILIKWKNTSLTRRYNISMRYWKWHFATKKRCNTNRWPISYLWLCSVSSHLGSQICNHLYWSISWCRWRIFNLVFLHWTFYWNYLIFLSNGPMSLQYWTKSSKKNWCSSCLSQDRLNSFNCTSVQSYNSTLTSQLCFAF